MNEGNLLIYIIISIGIMVSLSLGIILFFNISQRKIQAEALKNSELKLTFQKEMLERTIQTQEEERSRIAKDLHDDIGSKLSVLHLNLHMLKKEVPSTPQITEIIEDMTLSLSKSMERTRSISHELMPPGLSKFGLKNTIEELARNIKNTHVFNLDVIFPDSIEVTDESMKVNIFRIVQELIQNAIKHSKANNVRIHFEKKERILHLNYLDDGKGFSNTETLKGLGMHNLQTRIQLLKGQWNIDHEVPKGAKIDILFPL